VGRFTTPQRGSLIATSYLPSTAIPMKRKAQRSSTPDRGAHALYFLDAGGNVVKLIANDHLDNDSHAPFGPNSFLEIAEVGLATADTHGTRAALLDVLSAPILWDGREGWLLTAIGDDHGVVIVAPAGRGWVPVGLPAKACPLPSWPQVPNPRM
jgi:hypothetical protein